MTYQIIVAERETLERMKTISIIENLFSSILQDFSHLHLTKYCDILPISLHF